MSPSKTILVTGGGRGLGRGTTELLLAAGHAVTITCRSEAAGKKAVQEIRAQIPDAKVDFEILDLNSFASIRALAEKWNTSGRPLDILYNNSGTMQQSKERRQTSDGHEEIIQTNTLGPFLLTRLLQPSLKKGKNARVVFMSSSLHYPRSMGPSVNWNWEDPEQKSGFDPMVGYKNSKLGVNWTAVELARKWATDHIDVVAVCPGFVPETAADTQTGFMHYLLKYLMPYAPIAVRKTVAVKFLAGYLVDEKWTGKSGIFITMGNEKPASPQSQNVADAQRFWAWASQQVGLGA